MPERRIMKHMFSNGLRVFRERISWPRPPSWDPLAAYYSASVSRSEEGDISAPCQEVDGNSSLLASSTSSHAHIHCLQMLFDLVKCG